MDIMLRKLSRLLVMGLLCGARASRAQVPVVFFHGGPGYNSYSFAQLDGPLLEKQLRLISTSAAAAGPSVRGRATTRWRPL